MPYERGPVVAHQANVDTVSVAQHHAARAGRVSRHQVDQGRLREVLHQAVERVRSRERLGRGERRHIPQSVHTRSTALLQLAQKVVVRVEGNRRRQGEHGIRRRGTRTLQRLGARQHLGDRIEHGHLVVRVEQARQDQKIDRRPEIVGLGGLAAGVVPQHGPPEGRRGRIQEKDAGHILGD